MSKFSYIISLIIIGGGLGCLFANLAIYLQEINKRKPINDIEKNYKVKWVMTKEVLFL